MILGLDKVVEYKKNNDLIIEEMTPATEEDLKEEEEDKQMYLARHNHYKRGANLKSQKNAQ